MVNELYFSFFITNWTFSFGAKSGAEASDFNDDDWDNVTVPHSGTFIAISTKIHQLVARGDFLMEARAGIAKYFDASRTRGQAHYHPI